MKRYLFFLFIGIILISACQKEIISDIKPIILLKTCEGYVSTDVPLKAGEQFLIGINAASESGENLTNLIVKSNGIRIIDEGFNTLILSKDITLTKNLEDTEVLTFIIRNKARLADSISITLTKSGNQFADITRFSSITLGAQDNVIGNYFSFSTGITYKQSEAFNNQQIIDLVYFFDAIEDGNALASPGANLSSIITGDDAPDNWTTKRTTRYSREPIVISDEEFNAAGNDSLIVANFFADGGRKAKHLATGQYFGFVNNENKFGIVKIENITGQADGTVQFSLIIQK